MRVELHLCEFAIVLALLVDITTRRKRSVARSCDNDATNIVVGNITLQHVM